LLSIVVNIALFIVTHVTFQVNASLCTSHRTRLIMPMARAYVIQSRAIVLILIVVL
jgi:hypothetical protein